MTGPRDVREHVQAFMDSARPVAVIPSGTMLLTAVIGVSVLVLFGWGALTSFLRSLVTTMQGAVREHLAALLQDLNEQTKKSLLLEIGNATEEMQHSLTSRLEKTTEALTSQVSAIQTAVTKLGDAPRDGPNTTTCAEELWDSLRPVLTQWTQVQGDKNLKILQDWIDGATQAPSTSTVSSQALEDKMKDLHAAVMAQLQDLQGAVTTTTLNHQGRGHHCKSGNPSWLLERGPRAHRPHPGPRRRGVQGVFVTPQRGAGRDQEPLPNNKGHAKSGHACC